MITDIVAVITGFAQAVWAVIVDGLTELSTVFYTTGDNGGLTFIGTILFIGLGLTLVMFVISFVRNLVKA